MELKINGVTVGGLRKTAKLLLVFMTLLGGQIIFGTPVFGVTDASISISISAPLNLSLSPGMFGSTSQTISVTTDNYTGYTATLTNTVNATDLINSNDSSLVIPTITLPQGSSSITQNQFTNGIAFTTGHTLDTGIIAFNDEGFTIHLVVKMNPKNNSGKMLVSALQQNSGSSNYAGFTFYYYSQQYFYLNASTSSSISGTSFGTHINNNGWRVNNSEQTFTLDITYVPSPNKSISATFTPVRSGSSSFSSNDTNLMAYIPNSLENASIILSGSGVDSSKDLSNATVYEFSVTKP